MALAAKVMPQTLHLFQSCGVLSMMNVCSTQLHSEITNADVIECAQNSLRIKMRLVEVQCEFDRP